MRPNDKRNREEDLAHRFGFSNAQCIADERIARLVRYKSQLDERIRVAHAANVRPLAKAAGFSDEEIDSANQNLQWLLKAIRESQRHLAILCPKKKLQPNTKEQKECLTK